MRGRSWFAAVRPQGKGAGTWALPKGLADPGEGMRDAAAREVAEETGLEVEVVERLGDTRYTYTWEGERIFKIVGFFLMRPVGGRIGEILPAMRVEVAEARWLPPSSRRNAAFVPRRASDHAPSACLDTV